MKGLTRRAAAVAAAGVVVFATTATAQAQRPERTGDGIQTGQMSTQMFNYGTYLNNGGSTGTPNPITGVSSGCLTSTTAPCRLERLRGLFAFFQRSGVTSIELFGHQGFPASNDIPGLNAYRALMDEYGIHAAGWHGTVDTVNAAWTTRVNAAKILGADYIGSGGLASPGIGSLNNTITTAANLNALGKISVEAGVGPVYIHNHQGEWTTMYNDGGVTKPAWQIVMERTDPRYVNAEIDVFWSSDAFRDITGTVTATWINNYAERVTMLHIKDGQNVDEAANGSPSATGTGGLDFRPIFAAAKNKVQYYHHEHDGGSVANANTSFINLKGINTAVVPTVMGYPATFAAVQAGSTTASTPIKIENTGDAPLNITAVGITAHLLDAGQQNDFVVTSENCTTAGPLAAGQPLATPPVPRGSCTANVAFRPTKSAFQSVAKLTITSDADDATEKILIVGRSAADTTAPIVTLNGFANGATFLQNSPVAPTVTYTCTDNDTVASCVGTQASGSVLNTSTPGTFTFTVTGRDSANNETVVTRSYTVYPAVTSTGTVGGSVNATLSLTLGTAAAFGPIIPGVAADYNASTSATVTSTGGDAALTVADPSSFATGHLVNGTFSLPQALTARVAPTAFAAVGGSASPTTLKTYNGPVSNDLVTVDFRQSIGSTDALRTGPYSKTLTFTLSTTTP